MYVVLSRAYEEKRACNYTIYQKTNGRGLIYKNSKECIARAPFLCVHGEDIRKLTEKVAILAKLAKLTYCR